MPIAGDFAGVVEVVEHAELQRQLVNVGRDRFAVHGEFGIAVADGLAVLLEVAEDLIVGAILLDDVDDVLDAAIGRAGKGDLLLRGFHAVRLEHDVCPLAQIVVDLFGVERRDRPMQQGADVSVGADEALAARGFGHLHGLAVGRGAVAFGGGDVEVAA